MLKQVIITLFTKYEWRFAAKIIKTFQKPVFEKVNLESREEEKKKGAQPLTLSCLLGRENDFLMQVQVISFSSWLVYRLSIYCFKKERKEVYSENLRMFYIVLVK